MQLERQSVAFRLTVLSGVLIAGCAALFLYSVYYPACEVCDAVNYGADASNFQKNGFSRPLPGGLRVYGYPLFLSVVFAGYEWDANWGLFSPRAAIAQTVIYLAACLTLFFAVWPINRTFAWCVALGLMCNPFVLNYVPLRLSEGLTASIAVFLAALAVHLSRPTSGNRLVTLLLIGSLLAGFSMMVRPANLSLLLAWATTVAIFAWRYKDQRVAICIVGSLGIILPLLPQLATNYYFSAKFSVFPPKNLGQFQTNLGLSNWKYATLIKQDYKPFPTYYSTSMFTEQEIKANGIWLYIMHPLRGIVLAAVHIFQSINHDFFFTYVYGRNTWANAPINFIGHIGVFLAGFTTWKTVLSTIRGKAPDPAAVFALVAVLITMAVNSVAIVETRFGMLAYVAAGPVAVWTILQLRNSSPRCRWAMLAASVLYGLAAIALSFALLPQRMDA